MNRYLTSTSAGSATAAATASLPRWNLDVLYADVDDPRLDDDLARLRNEIGRLAESLTDAASADRPGERFDELVARLNAITAIREPIESYFYGKVTADTTDARAQARLSQFEELLVPLGKANARFTAWVGALDPVALETGSTTAPRYRDLIDQARLFSQHLMSPAEEDLLAELNPSAASAWEKLHQDVGSQIIVGFAESPDAAPEPMPLTRVRNYAYHPDRDVRRRAYETEIAAWETHQIPIAAAMNGIKGQVNATSRRRHFASPLDEAMAANRVDRETLDALVLATEDAFPVFRRYLRAKAKLLGLDRLSWFDLFAPTGAGADDRDDRWSYEASAEFIVRHFSAFSSRLGDLARTAFRESWIDAGPRPGKVGGAYCMPFMLGTSRILANFTPSYDGMSTLAHELGHAWHNLQQKDEPPVLHGAPMTLAETASTFCETLIRQAAMDEASETDRLSILESFLSGATQVSIDILSRFRFERSVFGARSSAQLSAEDLCELMTTAQAATYGDAVDPSTYHRYAWAAKPHYYSTASYYNYPYLFGNLFGIGLYSRFQDDPDGFHDAYDTLLRRTGQASPVNLANAFGIDIRDRAFWESSLGQLETDIRTFEGLVEKASARVTAATSPPDLSL